MKKLIIFGFSLLLLLVSMAISRPHPKSLEIHAISKISKEKNKAGILGSLLRAGITHQISNSIHYENRYILATGSYKAANQTFYCVGIFGFWFDYKQKEHR